MTFDRFNQAHLSALKTEILTDPIAMGYTSVIDNTTQLLKLLNDKVNNVGGETVANILTVELLHEALNQGDLDDPQVTTGKLEYIKSFLARDFNEDIERFRVKITASFKAGSLTVTNLNNQLRALSRAEVLFGEGTYIERQDWFDARDLG